MEVGRALSNLGGRRGGRTATDGARTWYGGFSCCTWIALHSIVFAEKVQEVAEVDVDSVTVNNISAKIFKQEH